MKATFPSLEFFKALQALMERENTLFERLGYFDAVIGVRVLMPDDSRREYVLTFEVFECTDVREAADLTAEPVDFTLEAGLDVWVEMFENIRERGAADAEHGINTMTHFGDRMRSIYDDPDAHDKQYRFAESIQAFFDLAARMEVEVGSPITERRVGA